jgi:hypothetical protein
LKNPSNLKVEDNSAATSSFIPPKPEEKLTAY